MNMSPKKSQQGRSGIVRRAGKLINKDERLEITYYHTGDINVEVPVYVAPSASVTGNIAAPKVVVAGMLYGIVAADTVIIDNNGQVWGDIYTVELHLEPGGKYYGWVITLDKGTVELLRSGSLRLGDVTAAGEHPMPNDFKEEHGLPDDQLPLASEQQTFILRRLRAELAASQLARIEIEMAFDERLAEIAEQDSALKSTSSTDPENRERSQGQESDHVGNIQTERSSESKYAKSTEQWRALETELNQYKLKAATCLEQLAWFNASKAADDDELVRMRTKTTDLLEESRRLRAEIVDIKSAQDTVHDEMEKESAIHINELGRELALAQLRIDELTADLAFFGGKSEDHDTALS
jgi:cytoskeletal protein CcmA (bactofilin family)